MSRSVDELERAVLEWQSDFDTVPEARAREIFEALLRSLRSGEIRAATRQADGRWQVNPWVKSGILLGFKLGKTQPVLPDGGFPFFDKDTYPLRPITAEDGIRIVPGGSAIRDGAYVAPGVICMPPMYINTGAWVGEATMVDSHALVGSCAQIGCRVHLSAGAQIGGVLEPAGALPVIIEDDVLVGGNCGVYEGTVVREGAVLAPGTILTGGTVVFDLVHNRSYRRNGAEPLEIPPRAVVVPGTRPVRTGPGQSAGIAIYAPVIIKYRDDRTDMSVRLEELLR